MSLKICILLILSSFFALKSDSNVSDISQSLNKSVQMEPNSTSSSIDDTNVNLVLLSIYTLSMGVLVILYYLKTSSLTDVHQFAVLLISGLFNVLTGIILFEVQTNTDFKFDQIKGTSILIQPLMGLKGNLEMTMASRMATLMNIREDMASCPVVSREIMDDSFLVQSQATVISLSTAILATLKLLPSFDIKNVINLCAVSLFTANLACFVLGIIISLIVVLTKRLDYDPDDFATPVAASLGDLVTLFTMVCFIYLITLKNSESFPVETLIVIVLVLLVISIFVFLSYQNMKTRPVLIHGWAPIIIAAIISSISGMIFDTSSDRYPKLATFQPLFNGFAGNCLALVTSRVSTSLHRKGPIGTTDETFTTFVSPYYAFCSKDNTSARTTTLLLIVVIPSQLLYILLISVIQEPTKFKLTYLFVIFYLLFSFFMIALLLYFSYNLTHLSWKLGFDPDMNAIPILTAVADLCGTIVLYFIYYLLHICGDLNDSIGK